MTFYANRKQTHFETSIPSRVVKGFKDPAVQNVKRLDKVEEQGVCIVLNKAIEKLKIIQQLLPNPDVKSDEHYQPMAVRMTALQKITPPEDKIPENIEALKHIQKSRYMTQQAYENVIQEVKGGSEAMVLRLKHILFTENRRYYDNFLLKQENKKLNNKIYNLNCQINLVKKNSQDTRLYLDKMTQFCLEQAAVTTWARSKTLNRNAGVAQEARVELNSMRLKDKEDNVINLREQYTSEAVKEDMINTEITNHLQMVTASLQKKLEKWTTRYSEEVDALDIALLQLRSKMDEQQEKFSTMSEQYSARQELMEVLQAEADERDRNQEMRLVQAKAAIIIQHWWREILFMRLVHSSSKKKGGQISSVKKNKKESPKKKK